MAEDENPALPAKEEMIQAEDLKSVLTPFEKDNPLYKELEPLMYKDEQIFEYFKPKNKALSMRKSRTSKTMRILLML